MSVTPGPRFTLGMTLARFVGIIVAAAMSRAPALGQGPKAASADAVLPRTGKCQFTLPADGWVWVDRPIGNAFVAAEAWTGWPFR